MDDTPIIRLVPHETRAAHREAEADQIQLCEPQWLRRRGEIKPELAGSGPLTQPVGSDSIFFFVELAGDIRRTAITKTL